MFAPYTHKMEVKLGFFSFVVIRSGAVIAQLRKNEIEKGIKKWKYTLVGFVAIWNHITDTW